MNIVIEKKCCKCKETKSVLEFYVDKSRSSGYTPACKDCHKKYYTNNRQSTIARIISNSDRQKKHDYDKRRRHEKRDEIREKKKNYFIENRDRLVAKFKEYYQNHREKAREYSRKWKNKNKEKVNEATRRRRARIAGGGGELSKDEWKAMLNKYGNKCLKCGSTERIEIDHVIPIALGGINDVYNVQPLCRNCNASKGNRVEDYR